MSIFKSIKALFKKHEHNYTIPVTIHGYPFLKCDTCNMHYPVTTEEEKRREARLREQVEELLGRKASF